jgi:hypothetical protein
VPRGQACVSCRETGRASLGSPFGARPVLTGGPRTPAARIAHASGTEPHPTPQITTRPQAPVGAGLRTARSAATLTIRMIGAGSRRWDSRRTEANAGLYSFVHICVIEFQHRSQDTQRRARMAYPWSRAARRVAVHSSCWRRSDDTEARREARRCFRRSDRSAHT